jgi:hypothetical protein
MPNVRKLQCEQCRLRLNESTGFVELFDSANDTRVYLCVACSHKRTHDLDEARLASTLRVAKEEDNAD